jgi:hypothetical protein
MNVGLAATYVELEGVDPKVFDIDDRTKRLQSSKSIQIHHKACKCARASYGNMWPTKGVH